MSKEFRTEIGVIGGGVAGLMVTKKLSELGYDVVLVDKQDKLASGPSTKNEGWLHAGGYHASAIEDTIKATKVAEQVMYGHEQIYRFAPEAVEDPGVPTLALIHDVSLIQRAEERWEDIGVEHRKLTKKQLAEKAPEVDIDYVSAAYEMKDKSVNFRILYQKLLHASENAGAKVITGATVSPEDEYEAQLHFSDGSHGSLMADIFICTTGLGTQEMFPKSELGSKMRYWKSHSLILPRLAERSLYYIDPYEGSVMNHGKFSIGCQNNDDFCVPQPSYDVEEDAMSDLHNSITRLIPAAENHRGKVQVSACVKPDITQKPGMARSVDNEMHEPFPNYIVAFPGKVTASPYMADKIVHAVFNRKSDERIALRPGDTVRFST